MRTRASSSLFFSEIRERSSMSLAERYSLMLFGKVRSGTFLGFLGFGCFGCASIGGVEV